MSKRPGKLPCVAAAIALAASLVACGGNAGTAPAASDSSSQQASANGGTATFYQAKNDDGFVNTLIGEKVGDSKVTNEDEAKKCLMGAMDRLGGDAKVELVFDTAVQSTGDTTIYTFTQQAGGVFVEGATVKLVVDKDASPTGIISSIMPGVEAKPRPTRRSSWTRLRAASTRAHGSCMPSRPTRSTRTGSTRPTT